MTQPVVVQGWTRAHWAAWRGDVDDLSAQLLRGLNLQVRDVDGWTVLHCAAAGDFSGECVSLLVRAGARVGSRDSSGATALHVAAGRSNEAAMCALLAAGANSVALDHNGKRPADFAWNLDVVHLLHEGPQVPAENAEEKNDVLLPTIVEDVVAQI